jgi:hypothetical protein
MGAAASGAATGISVRGSMNSIGKNKAGGALPQSKPDVGNYSANNYTNETVG